MVPLSMQLYRRRTYYSGSINRTSDPTASTRLRDACGGFEFYWAKEIKKEDRHAFRRS